MSAGVFDLEEYASRLMGKAVPAVDPAKKYEDEERAGMQEDIAPAKPDTWGFLDSRALSEALPPVPWLVESLGLAPGPVALVAGGGYSRKTMALQSMALSVARGTPLWGVFNTRQGRVVHLDYEQGRRLTQERYQRLARGMGFDLRELPRDMLKLAAMPRQYLDGPGAEEAAERAADGAALMIVDSLRASAPGADENSSEVRRHLDVLSHVGERTGAVVILIHHARKPSNDPSAVVDAKASIRGSGALFDACQSVFIFQGKKMQPTRVSHEKDRVRGQTVDDFGLDAEDVPNGSDPRWGLRVVHCEGEQLNGPVATLDGRARRIVEFLSAGPFLGNRTALAEAIGMRKEAFVSAISVLVGNGLVSVGGSRGDVCIRLTDRAE